MSRIRFGDLKPIPATEAKNRFGDLLYQVTLDGSPRLIERNGKPVAVVLRYTDYLSLTKGPAGHYPAESSESAPVLVHTSV